MAYKEHILLLCKFPPSKHVDNPNDIFAINGLLKTMKNTKASSYILKHITNWVTKISINYCDISAANEAQSTSFSVIEC